jgi:anti-sigma regulatory factor (Ser/Thr protein kinase)
MTAASIPRRIEALEEVFSLLEDELAAHEVDKGSSYEIKLATEEIFTNLVRHQKGGRDRIRIDLDVSEDEIVVRLTDFDAEPFDLRSAPVVDVRRPIEEREPGGLGLHLVRTMLDEVDYEHRDGNLTVVLVKRRGGRCSPSE